MSGENDMGCACSRRREKEEEEKASARARMGQAVERSGASSLARGHVHEVTLIDNGATWAAVFHPAAGHVHVASVQKGISRGVIVSSMDGARPETMHVHTFNV